MITNGPDLEWDWQYTDPGGAAYHEGSIHVFQNGFVGWPAPVGVGYWRSDDLGQTWIEVSEDPVFDGTDLDYVGRAALAAYTSRYPDNNRPVQPRCDRVVTLG